MILSGSIFTPVEADDRLFSLTIGDWSFDGHNQSNVVIIRMDEPSEESAKDFFERTLQAGAELIRKSICDYCTDFEDRKVDKLYFHELSSCLKDIGLLHHMGPARLHASTPDNESFAGQYVEVDPMLFIDLLLLQSMVGAGREVKYQLLSLQNTNCGGYGLYNLG